MNKLPENAKSNYDQRIKDAKVQLTDMENKIAYKETKHVHVFTED